jgi:hypothetical protein
VSAAAIRYVIDENLRGFILRYLTRHNAKGLYPIDVVRVGDEDGPPLSVSDPEMLIWTERSERILISHDFKTLPGHLADHLAAGRHSPGIFIARAAPEREIVEFLVVAAYASKPEEWQDQITVIP